VVVRLQLGAYPLVESVNGQASNSAVITIK